jgi:RNA polymerase sigma-70 factor (ECF subfamily)
LHELLEQHVTPVFRFALRLTGDGEAAEDLTQETMMRAWRNRARLREPQAARVWLFRIAVNAWRDQLRRRKSRPVVHLDAEPASPGASFDPARDLHRREDVDAALAALDALPARQRDVLYLHACEGLSNAHIAEVLGINTGAVKASLSVARQRIRALLEPQAGSSPEEARR